MKIPNKKVIAKRLDPLTSGRWQYRCKINGKTRKHSPETTDKLVAADRIKIWLEKVAAGNFDAAIKIEKKAPAKVMTIAQIFVIYKELGNVKHKTILGNQSMMRTYLSENGLTVNDSAAALNRLQAEKWLRKRKGKGDEEDQKDREYSAHSTLHQAKGIFKKDMLPHYDLPEGFDFPSVKTNQSKPRRFHPATDGRYARAWEYFESIQHSDSQLFTAFKLVAEYGLRNSEAANAKKSWLLVNCLNVMITKTDEPRQLPYQSDEDRGIFESNNPFGKSGLEGEYILAGSKTERKANIWRRLNAKLMELGFDGVKKTYELRKYFGSQVAQQTKSIWMAAEMLGNDPKVARAHYVGLLEAPKYNIRKAVA
tara:strand:+ start:275 stop:1375 length:1101 start_codon:yes stop_codon:yes gene_type:complete